MNAKEIVAYSFVGNLLPAYLFNYSLALFIATYLMILGINVIIAAGYQLWKEYHEKP